MNGNLDDVTAKRKRINPFPSDDMILFTGFTPVSAPADELIEENSEHNEETGTAQGTGHLLEGETDLQNAPKLKGKGGRKKKPLQNASYEEYQNEDIVDFIAAIEENNAIWDSSDKNYHRKEIKSSIFDSIEQNCSRFMMRGKCHGKTAEGLWKQLSDAYKSERKRLENPKSGSGAIVPRFGYMESLSFLDLERSRRSVTNCFVIGDNNGEVFEAPKPSDGAVPYKKSKKKDNKFDMLMQQMADGNKVLEKAVDKLLNGEPAKEEASTTCQNSRICSVYNHITSNLTEFEKIDVEAQVLSFLFKLKHQFANQNLSQATQSTSLADFFQNDFTT